jgi:ABC-2 type transport system permease protein
MVDNIMNILKELKITYYILLINIKNAMGLRNAFLLQTFGMFLNNFALTAIWIFFFQVFGRVNDWGVYETVALQGFVSIAFGVTFGFLGGIRKLPVSIHNGSFDSFLTRPRSLYMTILSSSVVVSAFGDILFGILMLVLYSFFASISLIQIFLIILLIPATVLIMVNFALIASMIAFLLPDADGTSKQIFELLLSPSLYPSSLFSGLIRNIFLFGIPALAVGGLPVEAVRDINIFSVAIVWGLAVAWFLIARFILSIAVKRYESGNLIAQGSLS